MITDSEKPVTCSIYSPQSQGFTSFQVSPKSVEKDLLLDSNGAGDSFVGGLLAKISLIELEQNYTKESVVEFTQDQITEAVKAGNLIAREVV